MTPVDLVIFDCDGVLVDSERIAARVGAAVLTDLGWPITEQEVLRRFVGCTDEYWRSEVEARVGRRLMPGWEKPYESWYEDAFEADLTAIPGIEVVLEELDDRGVPFCVASNGSHEKIRRNLTRTGLVHRFEGRMFSAQDVSRGKPSPELFLHAAATLDVDPSACVVVEDSPTGLAAARAAGMRCLAYASGIIPAERLRGPGTRVFTAMHELPGLLVDLERLSA